MKALFAILVLFLSFSLLFCAVPESASAQESEFAQDPFATDPLYPADTLYSDGVAIPFPTYDWESDVALYRGWGWGLFGSGMAVALAGFGVGTIYAISSAICNSGKECRVLSPVAEAGFSAGIIGSAAGIAGIGMLVADAVKYTAFRNKKITREHQKAVRGIHFSWKPKIYVSSAITGLGISGKF